MQATDSNHRTRIKICGVRDPETANFAIEVGADAIGLVFFAASPRAVEVEVARDIVSALPTVATSVALFVNPTEALVECVLREVAPTLLQFHGDESSAFCDKFAHPYWKAVRVSSGTDLLEFSHKFSSAQRLLLDADAQGADGGTRVYGGSGEKFDWSLIPATLRSTIVLSGGLTSDNVGNAIRAVHPWAVDVSSGVEAQRGVKSRDLIRRFIDAVQKEDSRADEV